MTFEDQRNFARCRALFAEEQWAREWRFLCREASWRKPYRPFLLSGPTEEGKPCHN